MKNLKSGLCLITALMLLGASARAASVTGQQKAFYFNSEGRRVDVERFEIAVMTPEAIAVLGKNLIATARFLDQTDNSGVVSRRYLLTNDAVLRSIANGLMTAKLPAVDDAQGLNVAMAAIAATIAANNVIIERRMALWRLIGSVDWVTRTR